MKSPALKYYIVYSYMVNGNNRQSMVSVKDKTDFSKAVAIRHAVEFTKSHKISCKVLNTEDGAMVFESKTSKYVEFEHAELVLLKGIMRNEEISLMEAMNHAKTTADLEAIEALYNVVLDLSIKIKIAAGNNTL